MNPFEKMDLKKDSFTKKELILYDVLKDNLQNILSFSASDLSKQYNISQSTITRFCQKIGYDGYNEFKFDVFRSGKQGNASKDDLSTLDAYIKLIEILKSSIDYEQLNHFANDIVKAHSIIILGMHKSALPAKLLQFNLFKYGKKAIFLDYGDIVNDFQQLVSEDDMVIIYTNRGNVLGSINSTLKDLIKKVSFNLSIITMNDKLSIKKHTQNYIWLPSTINQGFQNYLENQVVFFIYTDILTSEIAKLM